MHQPKTGNSAMGPWVTVCEELLNRFKGNQVAWPLESTVTRQLILLGFALLVGSFGCRPKDRQSLLVARETFAELRTVKGQVMIQEHGKRPRKPYPRERIGLGCKLSLEPDSLAYMRDDHGATWLISGPTHARVSERGVDLSQGKVFVDTQGGTSVALGTPSGALEISEG